MGGNTPELFANNDYINMAGRLLVDLHTWAWLRSPPALLDLVADQSYIDLPSDFGRVLSVETTSGSGYIVSFVDIGTLNEYRNASVADAAGWALALTYAAGTGNPAGDPYVPRFEIWPTPTSNASDALRMFYLRQWTDVDTQNPTEKLNLPPYMEMLYWRVLREVILGFEEDDMASMEARIDALRASKVFDMAMAADMGQAYPTTGAPIRKGIGMHSRRDILVYPDTVPAPAG
ncbi:MAG: hypothetical protein D6746_08490 [Bacteroidetes bacterium]|nr:MAG: hypothetical protein D6746_08490 [Bacteroidota bacterium]